MTLGSTAGSLASISHNSADQIVDRRLQALKERPPYRSQYSVPTVCSLNDENCAREKHPVLQWNGCEHFAVSYRHQGSMLRAANFVLPAVNKAFLVRIEPQDTSSTSTPNAATTPTTTVNSTRTSRKAEPVAAAPKTDTMLLTDGSDPEVMPPGRVSERRRSSGASIVQSTTRDGFTPHPTNSAFYSIPQLSNALNRMGHLNGATLQLPSPKLSVIGVGPCLAGHKASIAPPYQPSGIPTGREHRRKAVITVDASTTEILIANDNVCRLFALKDRSLIGRKLRDVFAGEEPTSFLHSLGARSFSGSIDLPSPKPTIINNTLFNANGKLAPVYGKPVDIVDADGALATVCVWSYPLTPAAALVSQRKTSTMLMKCPSEHLPHVTNGFATHFSVTTSPHSKDPPQPSVAVTSQSSLTPTPPRLVNHFHVGPDSSLLPVPSALTLAKDTAPQRSKSTCAAYSPYLKVLQEEQLRHYNNTLASVPVLPATLTTSPISSGSGSEDESPASLTGTDEEEEFDDASSGPPSDSEALNAKFESELDEMREHASSFLLEEGGGGATDDEPDEQRKSSKGSGGSKGSVRKNGMIAFHPELPTRNDKTIAHPTPPTHDEGGAASRRWLILMEPISALHIDVILGAKGRIFRTDDSLANVLGYECTNRLFGTEIHKLLPALKLGAEFVGKEQLCCGLTIKKNGVPFNVVVHSEFLDGEPPLSYEIQIRSLASINGVVTITESGLLYSFNENFLHELVGRLPGSSSSEYSQDGKCVLMITDLIPGFFGTMNDDSAPAGRIPGSCSSKPSTSTLPDCLQEPGLLDEDELQELIEENSEQAKTHVVKPGVFFDLARHADGSLVPVRFEIAPLDMPSSPQLFAVCVSFDRSSDYGFTQLTEEDVEMRPQSTDSCRRTRDSDDSEEFSFVAKSEPKFSIGGTIVERSASQRKLSVEEEVEIPLNTLEDENNALVCGEYSRFYDTFQLIGNGAFGSVKLSARKSTGLLSVTKFVNKSKVLPESWVKSEKRNRMVPIEVHLLESLRHPNIVTVLNVYENATYYQLVMEKLGCGMDLFEFIDNQPKLDEALTSYIFRQIVSAVYYLHSNHIVHRDLKDENVIIDQDFSCKLIDFGSAAYFGENIVFSTFCGTMEYCSPEVLTGNKYLGPELEMWSLGVLLYTLVFYENPFRTVEETIQATMELPWAISDALFEVLDWLLQADPKHRATVLDVRNHHWVNQPVNPSHYKFQELLKSCERALVIPPLYVSELATHITNASSCSNLAINQQLAIDKPESGAVSAR